MRAIDTNIVIRALTKDDPVQAQSVQRILEAGNVLVGTTVVLESEWVLRTAYGYSTSQIIDGLTILAGYPGVILEEQVEVAQALEWLAGGMDFADALHLARSRNCDTFFTFDRKLAKRAEKLGITSVTHP